MATLYNKLNESCIAPDNWARSVVILVYKDGNTDDATNFRMIALTSCLAKPYHFIKAERLGTFMVKNGYLDPMVKKGFMEHINGCVEHTTVLQEILQHAKHNKKTLHMSSYDLQDAFGSVSHSPQTL